MSSDASSVVLMTTSVKQFTAVHQFEPNQSHLQQWLVVEEEEEEKDDEEQAQAKYSYIIIPYCITQCSQQHSVGQEEEEEETSTSQVYQNCHTIPYHRVYSAAGSGDRRRGRRRRRRKKRGRRRRQTQVKYSYIVIPYHIT